MKQQDNNKQFGEERGWLVYASNCSPLKDVRTGTQDVRNLEAGPDTEAMEESYLLACFP